MLGFKLINVSNGESTGFDWLNIGEIGDDEDPLRICVRYG